jgi:hypothetical protein
VSICEDTSGMNDPATTMAQIVQSVLDIRNVRTLILADRRLNLPDEHFTLSEVHHCAPRSMNTLSIQFIQKSLHRKTLAAAIGHRDAENETH